MSGCAHFNVSRSRRKPRERLLALFFVRPYRCQDCDQRLWRRQPSATAGMVWLAFGLLILVLTLI